MFERVRDLLDGDVAPGVGLVPGERVVESRPAEVVNPQMGEEGGLDPNSNLPSPLPKRFSGQK